MSASTTRLGLTKPGGGSTGLITPADLVDIDVLNANFDKIDSSIGIAIVTSGTRPSIPFPGQPIFETDTGNLLYWNTTVGRWIPIGIPNAASSAVRDALFPAPVGGERAYRVDLGYVQRYSVTYSAWKPDLGLGLIPLKPTSVAGAGVVLGADGIITATAATAVSLNGCFTSDFSHYLISFDFPTVAGVSNLEARLRAAGADLATNTYSYTGMSDATRTTGTQNGFYLSRSASGVNVATGHFDLWNPAQTVSKRLLYDTMASVGGVPINERGVGSQGAITAFDGITLLTDGNTAITGTVQVYGYNNE